MFLSVQVHVAPRQHVITNLHIKSEAEETEMDYFGVFIGVFVFLMELLTSMYVCFALTNKECLSLKEVSWNFEALHISGDQMELYLTLPYCTALLWLYPIAAAGWLFCISRTPIPLLLYDL